MVVEFGIPLWGRGLSGRFGPRNQTKVVWPRLMLRLWQGATLPMALPGGMPAGVQWGMRTEPEFTQSTSPPGHGKGDVSSATVASQLSGPLTALAGSAFASGVVYGLPAFLQRSPIRAEPVAGSAAWGQ